MKQEAIRFKDFRQTLGMTQAQLADELGVTQVRIAKFETGILNVPIDMVKTMYKKYKLSYVWFFHGFGKQRVDDVSKATITTDLKEVLLENKILKEKISVLEKRLEQFSMRLEKLEI